VRLSAKSKFFYIYLMKELRGRESCFGDQNKIKVLRDQKWPFPGTIGLSPAGSVGLHYNWRI